MYIRKDKLVQEANRKGSVNLSHYIQKHTYVAYVVLLYKNDASLSMRERYDHEND